jgi:hypothetical protein
MVFPQAKQCYMGDVGNDADAALNQVANDKGVTRFMKGIVDRVTSPREDYAYRIKYVVAIAFALTYYMI